MLKAYAIAMAIGTAPVAETTEQQSVKASAKKAPIAAEYTHPRKRWFYTHPRKRWF